MNYNEIRDTIWKTKCGLYLKPGTFQPLFTGSMFHGGIEYCPENNNVVITCLLEKPTCEMPDFPGNIVKLKYHCIVSQTEEPYDYERSLEKVEDDQDKASQDAWEDLIRKDPNIRGCACIHSGKMVDGKFIFNIRMDLSDCLVFQHGCEKKVCAITKKPRNTDLVNIFYDTCTVRQEGLFTSETWVKNIKYFSHPVTRECAERKLKELEKEPESFWKSTKSHPKPVSFRISNRPVRDLLSDLQAARDGTLRESVEHSELKKQKADAKRARSLERKTKRDAKAKASMEKACQDFYEKRGLVQKKEVYEQTELF